ncbi:Extracellular protein [Fulvia fulva]|uniref:Extracellular protein n=1 Tax=Passalora fulva TaxID=5499 RepID=A0A9Q8PMS9_PASFU|nr:Extracellular protein [Fulvia fulva]KAK4608828.1 Extracellular protein [Fulvia fulva]KAK4609542.1 Extracellular protein [Fulvia fulva]UJO25249.1 Extracellular protein [Fulvia fulva]WPV22560.1 Extracellular protein [Fulvia fulva]WPV37461.1 Extracellular protein [Fulvia fulva]
MGLKKILALALTGAVTTALAVPSLDVHACPSKCNITYDKSVPDLKDFPRTQVDLCYDDNFLNIDFTAYNETNFYYNESLTTNGPIFNYEVQETFIALGTDDPTSYLEFEVAPNNVKFNAWIYNPSKTREEGAPFETTYIDDDGVIPVQTSLDKEAETWVSNAQIPLKLFGLGEGQAQGTQWRMNFFRIVCNAETCPNEQLGGWSPPNEASFHETPSFGNVKFV